MRRWRVGDEEEVNLVWQFLNFKIKCHEKEINHPSINHSSIVVYSNRIVLSNPCGFHNQRILIIPMYGFGVPRMGPILPLLQESKPEGNRGDLVWRESSQGPSGFGHFFPGGGRLFSLARGTSGTERRRGDANLVWPRSLKYFPGDLEMWNFIVIFYI